MINVIAEDGTVFKYTEEEFLEEARGLIEFALNDKEYTLDDISVIMIAEDFTGVIENHGVDDRGLVLIEEVLNSFYNN